METTQTLYTVRLNREDAERVIAALRAQAGLVIDRYIVEHDASENFRESPYGATLYNEYGILKAIADDIEFILPE